LNKQQVNTDLQKVIAKTVAGLMNSEGGTLIIGVADDGTVPGLESDCGTLKKSDNDGFEQALRQVLSDYLGAEYSQYAHVSFPQHDGKAVCIIKIDRTPRPVYLTDKGSTDF
jgi:predicted HTH transcriptional regulator